MYFNVTCKIQIIYLIATAIVLKKKVCCDERKHNLLLDLKTEYLLVKRR